LSMAASGTGFSRTWLALPLAVLAVNLVAALVTRPVFHRLSGLLVFHIGLLGLIVLAAASALIRMEGRVEITEGQNLAEALVHVTERGPLHRLMIERVRFRQGPVTVDYAPGLVRQDTVAVIQPDDDIAANNTTFNADPRDTATPAGMASLLRKIWDRDILSEESSRLLIDIMYRCQTGEARLKGALPPGTEVAHKTGTIGETTNDVGIIDLPGGAGHVVTVVYIKESKLENNAAMEPVIAQIARAVHDYFVFNPGKATSE